MSAPTVRALTVLYLANTLLATSLTIAAPSDHNDRHTPTYLRYLPGLDSIDALHPSVHMTRIAELQSNDTGLLSGEDPTARATTLFLILHHTISVFSHHHVRTAARIQRSDLQYSAVLTATFKNAVHPGDGSSSIESPESSDWNLRHRPWDPGVRFELQ